MIVALGTLDANPQKQLSRRFRRIDFIAAGFPVSGRRILLRASGRGEQLVESFSSTLTRSSATSAEIAATIR